jgi:hypothetical protein
MKKEELEQMLRTLINHAIVAGMFEKSAEKRRYHIEEAKKTRKQIIEKVCGK